jgi:perosamine synthetase
VIFRFPLEYGLTDASAGLLSLLWRERPECAIPFYNQAIPDARHFPTRRGREALYLILKNLGLKPGARVGLPLYLCSVVAKTVAAAGMTPVFVDADPYTFGLNEPDLEDKAKNLESLIVVHTFGYPTDLTRIKKVMRDRPVIEDCAHSLGSSRLGRPLGLSSDASFFSFGFFKPLSASGGGCAVTTDNNLAARLASTLSQSPSESSAQSFLHIAYCLLYAIVYNHPIHSVLTRSHSASEERIPSLNRNDHIDATFVSSHLKLRRTDSHRISARLRSVCLDQIGAPDFWAEIRRRLPSDWYIPQDPVDGEWNHFMLPILAPSPEACAEAIKRLRKNGVDAARVYPHCASETRAVDYQGDCLEAERLAKHVFTIPSHAQLSPEEQSHILRSV